MKGMGRSKATFGVKRRRKSTTGKLAAKEGGATVVATGTVSPPQRRQSDESWTLALKDETWLRTRPPRPLENHAAAVIEAVHQAERDAQKVGNADQAGLLRCARWDLQRLYETDTTRNPPKAEDEEADEILETAERLRSERLSWRKIEHELGVPVRTLRRRLLKKKT